MKSIFKKQYWIGLFAIGILLLWGCTDNPLTASSKAALATSEPILSEQPPEFSGSLDVPDPTIVITTPIPTPEPTPTPSPTPTPTPSPSPTPEGLIGGKYLVFSYGDEPIRDEFTYQSDKVSITMSIHTDNPYTKRKLTYFVADIYIQNIESLRSKAAKGFKVRKTGKIEKISAEANAIVAINGDYFIHNQNSLLVRNGIVYTTRYYKGRDICMLHTDGTITVCKSKDYDPNMDFSDVWQAWQFGPYLLEEDGTPRSDFSGYGIRPLNPRTVLGYYEPGHYCFVLVEGRRSRYSEGLTLENLAKLMADLGCKQAYNLDGGNSSQLYWDNRLYNDPSGSSLRPIPDIIYVVEPSEITDAAELEPGSTPKGGMLTPQPTAKATKKPAVTDAPTEPAETPSDAPSEAPSETPGEPTDPVPTDTPAETTAPTDEPSVETEAPTSPPTSDPTEAATQAPAQGDTQRGDDLE